MPTEVWSNLTFFMQGMYFKDFCESFNFKLSVLVKLNETERFTDLTEINFIRSQPMFTSHST